MDFSLPDEILKYKEEAREWVENVLDPLSKPLEEDEKLPDELVTALKKGKFFGLTIPKEYGGQGWSAVEWFPVLEELAKAYATVRLIAHTMNGLFWRPILILEPKIKRRNIYPSWRPARSGPPTA
jgi:acyl-CoA dehydrogenase